MIDIHTHIDQSNGTYRHKHAAGMVEKAYVYSILTDLRRLA